MEIVTSWERKAKEEIALNLLREGMDSKAIARVTGLSVERVQQLLRASYRHVTRAILDKKNYCQP